MCFLFALEITGTAVGSLHDLHNVDVFQVVVKELRGTYLCFLVQRQPWAVSGYWVSIIIFETIVFSLTMWKFTSDLRHTPPVRRFSLIKLIVRDSVMYYGIWSYVDHEARFKSPHTSVFYASLFDNYRLSTYLTSMFASYRQE
ncbi:hypothetical protein BDQ17DRAFT_1327746 [Cyathus striatus]|nr:hypothetical protein BDQ17DRAFT_1327746 [Cyathus striatus]